MGDRRQVHQRKKETGTILRRLHSEGRDKAVKLYQALLKLVETGVIVLEPEASYAQAVLRTALQHRVTLYGSLHLAQARKLGEIPTSDIRQAEATAKLGINWGISCAASSRDAG